MVNNFQLALIVLHISDHLIKDFILSGTSKSMEVTAEILDLWKEPATFCMKI